MQVEFIGGITSPDLWDLGPGGNGGYEFGSAYDYVDNGWSRTDELYSGTGWEGNFSVVEPEGDRDIVVAGLGTELIKAVVVDLIKDGAKVYWNFLMQSGSPSPDNNGTNWQNSPFFTQGA